MPIPSCSYSNNYHHSGAATTASRLGQPDLAIATLNDFVDAAEMVCSLDPQVPVIADADTGSVPFNLILPQLYSYCVTASEVPRWSLAPSQSMFAPVLRVCT